MPYLRRRPRVPATGSITLRLRPEQRDLFVAASEISMSLRQDLHRAPVREGKLTARVNRVSLDAMILVAARIIPKGRQEEKQLNALLRYLETKSESFEETGDDHGAGPSVSGEELTTPRQNSPAKS